MVRSQTRHTGGLFVPLTQKGKWTHSLHSRAYLEELFEKQAKPSPPNHDLNKLFKLILENGIKEVKVLMTITLKGCSIAVIVLLFQRTRKKAKASACGGGGSSIPPEEATPKENANET